MNGFYILTFDIEDWYLSYHSTQMPLELWDKQQYRTERNTDLILDFLNQRKLKATFFFLGYEIKKNPSLLRKVHKEGHELGFHGMYHVPPHVSGREKFQKELRYGLSMMSDISGAPIYFYRAPGFSLNAECEWLPEVVAAEGIVADSSVVSGTFVGRKRVPDNPFLWERAGIKLAEFPLSKRRILGFPVKYSGSGYLRLWPLWLLQNFFSRGNYHMLYFHPRDFDTMVPISTELPWYRNIMNRIGNAGTLEKLSSLAFKYSLTSLGQAYNQWKGKIDLE